MWVSASICPLGEFAVIAHSWCREGLRPLTQWEGEASGWLVAPPVRVDKGTSSHPELKNYLLSNLDAAAPQGEAPLPPHLAPPSPDTLPCTQPGLLSMTLAQLAVVSWPDLDSRATSRAHLSHCSHGWPAGPQGREPHHGSRLSASPEATRRSLSLGEGQDGKARRAPGMRSAGPRVPVPWGSSQGPRSE